MAEPPALAATRAHRHEVPHLAAPYETLAQQARAAHLGMWVFLASEALLFAGLFALYFAYRAMYPAGFIEGVEHNTHVLGSVNTGVLLTSSYLVALAVHTLRTGRRRATVWLLLGAMALGAVFLAIKFTEYGLHFHEGIYPGEQGRFFSEHHAHGIAVFWTLYFVTTGLHALHVTVGLCVLGWLAARVVRGTVVPAAPHPLALGAMYWHLVDVIWIVVWPVYYLAGAG